MCYLRSKWVNNIPNKTREQISQICDTNLHIQCVSVKLDMCYKSSLTVCPSKICDTNLHIQCVPVRYVIKIFTYSVPKHRKFIFYHFLFNSFYIVTDFIMGCYIQGIFDKFDKMKRNIKLNWKGSIKAKVYIKWDTYSGLEH